MNRRAFVLGSFPAFAALAARNRLDMSRVAVLTDEVARSPEDAIAFCKRYGVNNVELRGVPGRRGAHYGHISEEDAKAAAREFRDNGLRVSFLNTGFLKIILPGTIPVSPANPEALAREAERSSRQFAARMTELDQAIRNAHIYGVDKLRVFTFLRVAEPETVFPRVAEVISEMAARAQKEGIRILVENEASCNVLSCAEMAGFIKLLPQKNVGINWDPYNATQTQETAFPDGYNKLPSKRIWNVQFKGHSLVGLPEQRLPWPAILARLSKDGYGGMVGLETHFGQASVERSPECMDEIVRLVKA